ncbi:MAG: type II toxin-antitoxin system PrlF family antitoxin [Gammaproteobacteria bacterium]|jgi:antitoxin PrlF|nr:type II toxin-antitoxin system PrlF family antitoxin [Gammaproteobacteria bacterium]
MNPTIEAESRLTDRYQTTVPADVRKALALEKRDRLHYEVRPNGEVVLTRSGDNDDPALAAFLNFLADDMTRHPERLRGMDPSLARRIESLVDGVEVDLDAPLYDEDE